MLKFLDQWHGFARGLDYGHAQTKCDQLGDDPPARLQLPGSKESATLFGKSIFCKVFNSLTIPTTDFYLSFEYDDNPWLKRANLKVVSIKVSLNISFSTKQYQEFLKLVLKQMVKVRHEKLDREGARCNSELGSEISDYFLTNFKEYLKRQENQTSLP